LVRVEAHAALAAFEDYVARLEQVIRERPGSWHAWGDVDLYFVQP
jgi:predicted LPLAT superfamily acyltransferase